MKHLAFLMIGLVINYFAIAQEIHSQSKDTIHTISGDYIAGEIMDESADSVRIKTGNGEMMTFAQKDILHKTIISVETSDGNRFVGELIGENDSSITIRTVILGDLKIKREFIKSQKEVRDDQIKQGKLWFENPQSTRYFWAPNAYGLKKGEGYYQNIYVFWNQANFGITDYWSLGVGVVPVFLMGAPTPVFATTKLDIPIVKDKFNIAAGALAGTIIGENLGAFGVLFGIATYGSRDNNVSIGLGYAFGDGDISSTPLINFSGLFRVSDRAYIITENYVFTNENYGIISAGGRWMINKTSLDAMLGVPLGAGGFYAVPLLGFTVPF